MVTLIPTPRSARHGATAEDDLFPWRRALAVVFILTLVAGLVGMWLRLTQGHLAAGYGSYVPWGLWVAVYFHGVGVAAGAFGISAVGHLAGIRGFRTRRTLRIASVVVAAAVVPALLAVGLDLGRMSRAYRILIDPSFTSMMAFNAWTYLALLALAGAVWVLSFRPDRGWLKPVLVLGVLLSVMTAAQSGAFLAVVGTDAFWHTALLPVLMLTSGVTAGAAALLFVRAYLTGPGLGGVRQRTEETLEALGFLRRVVLAGLVTYFVLEFAEISVVSWGDLDRSPELSMILTGRYWWVFWLVHVVLGGVVPFALLVTRRPLAWVTAGALVAVAFISTRLNVLIPGQSVGELEGLQDAYFHPRLDYVYDATLMEYLVALFCLALAMVLLYLGLRVTSSVESRLAGREARHVPN